MTQTLMIAALALVVLATEASAQKGGGSTSFYSPGGCKHWPQHDQR